MIKVKDYKHYFLGDKVNNSVFAYEVHDDIGDALNAQRRRYNTMHQNLRVYGIRKLTNQLVVVSNKLPKNF